MKVITPELCNALNYSLQSLFVPEIPIFDVDELSSSIISTNVFNACSNIIYEIKLNDDHECSKIIFSVIEDVSSYFIT